MEHWWKRRNVELGESTKCEVEDLTGCIPLLLEKSAETGKIDLGAEEMRSVWNHVALFVARKYTETQSTKDRWKRSTNGRRNFRLYGLNSVPRLPIVYN